MEVIGQRTGTNPYKTKKIAAGQLEKFQNQDLISVNTGSSAAPLSRSRSKEKIVNLKLVPYNESTTKG